MVTRDGLTIASVWSKPAQESFAFLRGMLLLFVKRWYSNRSSSKGRTGPRCTQRSEVSVSKRVIGESTRSETAKKGNRKQQRKEGKSIGTQRNNTQGCEKLFRTLVRKLLWIPRLSS